MVARTGRWLDRKRAIALAAAALLVAIAGVAAWGGRSALQRQSAGEPPKAFDAAQGRSVPFGQSFFGVHLPADDVRAAANRTGLTIRQGCAWGEPGRHPYRGTVTQALEAARLPEEVVRRIDTMVSLGIVSDQVVISRDAIRAVRSQRRFDSTIVAMGFANTLCFGTRVNFEPGHLEFADLYDATDGKGNNYAVMVPYVCGNVSVLAERAEQEDLVAGAAMAPPGTAPGVIGVPRGAMSSRPGASGGGGRGRIPATPQDATLRTVPEPGTLAALVAGLAAMAAARCLSRRRGTPAADESTSRAGD